VIRATAADSTGRPVVLLGLSDENLRRLAADQPIRVDLAELGFPAGAPVVVLFGGGTEESLADQLLDRLPPEDRRRVAVELVRDRQRRKASDS
jgi:hypothetical protein